jgi:hypothetical protein
MSYRYGHPRYRRTRYRRDGGAAVPAVIIGAAILAATGAHAATKAHGAPHAPGPGEAAFMSAVLADLGAPASQANIGSLEAWVQHETPWPPVASNNPMNSTLAAPGSTAYNYLPGGGSVQNYPAAAEGAGNRPDPEERLVPGDHRRAPLRRRRVRRRARG